MKNGSILNKREKIEKVFIYIVFAFYILYASANRYGWLTEGYPIFSLLAMPSSAFLRDSNYSINEISKTLRATDMTVFGSVNQQQITVDGIRLLDPYAEKNKRSAYGHFSVKGAIELFTTNFFNPNYRVRSNPPTPPFKYIYKQSVMEKTISQIEDIVRYYTKLSVETPINISCAIINGRGFTIPVDDFLDCKGEIDRDLLLTPDVTIDTLSESANVYAKPILDAIWNACGYTRCPAYDEDGLYTGL